MPTRKPLSAGAWIAIFFGVALLGLCCLTGGVMAIKYGRKTETSAPATTDSPIAAKPKIGADGCYVLSDLKQYLLGKNELEAYGLFGNPLRVKSLGPLSVYLFLCSVRDTSTGHKDTIVAVISEKYIIKDVSCGDDGK